MLLIHIRIIKLFLFFRIFFLLTYLGRRSIGMGTCRSIVIDAVLKTLAKLLAPISPRFQEASEAADNLAAGSVNGNLWTKTDLQLITWLLLFLSVCLDDNERKDKCNYFTCLKLGLLAYSITNYI